MTDAAAMARAVAGGDRRALSRAITLVESDRADHHAAAQDILAALPADRTALRVGLSGTPGVGKSTFLEALGLHLTRTGHRVAVLAVDPTSARTGGSILGDKTRMDRLSRDPAAYIRPSPARGQLGGVARRTREVAALCEGAGFDIVLIETVGVGQSETMVVGMTDVFVLLLAPGAGDELQGVKRGITEIADLVLVNKADGDRAAQATRTVADYTAALRLMRPRPGDPAGTPRAMPVSALDGTGIADAWTAIAALADHRRASGALAATRAAQARDWFREELQAETMALLSGDLAALEEDVAAGRLTPAAAAARALAGLRGA